MTTLLSLQEFQSDWTYEYYNKLTVIMAVMTEAGCVWARANLLDSDFRGGSGGRL